MSSQMEADALLAEHRAVMAALMRSCIQRPTDEQYEAVLSELRGVMSCPETTGSPSPALSSGAL
jgi:hypothetical protein